MTYTYVIHVRMLDGTKRKYEVGPAFDHTQAKTTVQMEVPNIRSILCAVIGRPSTS